mgnify:CR=1 FL=1
MRDAMYPMSGVSWSSSSEGLGDEEDLRVDPAIFDQAADFTVHVSQDPRLEGEVAQWKSPLGECLPSLLDNKIVHSWWSCPDPPCRRDPVCTVRMRKLKQVVQLQNEALEDSRRRSDTLKKRIQTLEETLEEEVPCFTSGVVRERGYSFTL